MPRRPGGSPATCVRAPARQSPAPRHVPVAEISSLNMSTSVTLARGTGWGVRDRLRGATSAVHEALHGAAPFVRIAAGQLDRAGYAALLEALHAFHTSVAPLVSRACAELALPAVERGAQRRREDLRLDLRTCDPHICAAPEARGSLAEIEPLSGAFSVGCLYTVLGSTLGGKLIYRQLDYLFEGREGRRFFAGTLEDGPLWRSFCEELERYGASGQSMEAIGAGASFAFAHFAACLEGQA